MINVTVDDKMVSVDLPNGVSAAEVFARLRDQLRGFGRIVTEVRLAGQVVVWGDGSLAWSRPLVGDRAMEIRSASPAEVSGALLRNVQAGIADLAARHQQLAGRLRLEGSAHHGADLVTLLAWWQELDATLAFLAGLYEAGNPECAAALAAGRELLAQATNRIASLCEALELKDDVLAADSLEYELAPLAEQCVSAWQRIATVIG